MTRETTFPLFPQGIASVKLSDIALSFYIFATVVFSEGDPISMASKVFLFVIAVFECVKNKRFASNGFIVAAAIFFCLSFASIAWSQAPSESVARVKTLLYQLVCYSCVVTLVYDDARGLKICLASFVVSALISAVVVILVNGVTFQDNRTSEGVVSSGQLAVTACFSMMLCLYLFKKEKKQIYLFALLVFAVIMLLTSSRRDLFAFLVFCLVFLTISSSDIRKRLGTFALVGLVCLLILLLCLNVDFLYQFVGYRLESFLNFVIYGEGGDASTTGRSRLIDFGMNLFAQSPILGNGVGTFEYLFSGTHGSWLTSADNNYVELLSDLGVVGFGVYYVPLVVFLSHAIRGISHKDAQVKFGLAGVIAFSAIDFATVWFFSKCGMLMILFFYLMTKIPARNAHSCSDALESGCDNYS